MDKHTPGPWKLRDVDTWAEIIAPEYDSYLPIASSRKKGDYDEMVANAHLIAAAPDLLAALEDMVETIEIGEGPGAVKDNWPNALKAIAKAKGML